MKTLFVLALTALLSTTGFSQEKMESDIDSNKFKSNHHPTPKVNFHH